MKTKSKCIGCQSIKLVNSLGLCKRCNRHAHDFISAKEMARIKAEREALFLATKAAKKAKKEEEEKKTAEEAEAAEEEGEGEEEGAETKEGTEDAGAGEEDKTGK